MTNNQTLALGELAYDVIRAAKINSIDLPLWAHVHQDKQAAIANAAFAAYEGAQVWDVWALFCGIEVDSNTRELYTRQPSDLRKIPTILTAFGTAVSNATELLSPKPAAKKSAKKKSAKKKSAPQQKDKAIVTEDEAGSVVEETEG